MNPDRKRWLIRGVKFFGGLLILGFIGWQFRALPEHDFSQLEWRPGWLAASGGLYLVGLIPSAWFWRYLFQRFGYPAPLLAAMRAHYISQLGKYVPGKALAVAMRAIFLHPWGVPYGVSIIASFYEVLTGMAAGALVAALIYLVQPPAAMADLGWHPLWVGVGLVALCGVPLMPGVFNFVIARLESRIQAVELYRLPPVRFGTLALGLAVTGAGWWVIGLAWWAMLQAVLVNPPDLTPYWWAQCTASIAFANVAGFAIAVLPGGLGVREVLLWKLLSSETPDGYIALAALLLRLDWIVAEALFAAGAYWIKPVSPRISKAFPGGNGTP